VAEATGAADRHRERDKRYKEDRGTWQATIRQYQGRKALPVNERDGWYSLDDPYEYDFMSSRWPVILDDGVRAPPATAVRNTALPCEIAHMPAGELALQVG
jgi:hypothetical protein